MVHLVPDGRLECLQPLRRNSLRKRVRPKRTGSYRDCGEHGPKQEESALLHQFSVRPRVPETASQLHSTRAYNAPACSVRLIKSNVETGGRKSTRLNSSTVVM